TAGVLPSHGPSSNVSTTSPLRRKSCILKCSQPKPGPPLVSISTTRETRIAFGFVHDDAGAAAGGGAAANAAGAGAAGAVPAAGALVCAHATVNAPTETDTTIAHALATRIACSLAVTGYPSQVLQAVIEGQSGRKSIKSLRKTGKNATRAGFVVKVANATKVVKWPDRQHYHGARSADRKTPQWETRMRTWTAPVLAAAWLPAGGNDVAAQETLKIAVTERGLWDTAVSELGQRAGIMKKHGLALEILYTSGGAESQQALVAGSVELACGGGIEGAIGGFSKGAPLRIIGSEMIGSPDTYWYVVSSSPIRSMKDAGGQTISHSVTGSSSHTAVLSLISQYKVDAKPVATGNHPTTLTMTMTGQIDIGRGAAPFGLEMVEEGKIRVIARGSEIAARAHQTVRVCIAHV